MSPNSDCWGSTRYSRGSARSHNAPQVRGWSTAGSTSAPARSAAPRKVASRRSRAVSRAGRVASPRATPSRSSSRPGSRIAGITVATEKLPADQWLRYYAERLPAVEINYTFYRMPNAKTIGQWLETTPDGFTFVLKVSQRITHHARLKEVEQPLRYFTDTAAKLGPKLGPLLFQLPPNFKKDADRLGEVLRLVPETIRTAWEFRHESWFADDVYHMLRARNAALCVADTEDG